MTSRRSSAVGLALAALLLGAGGVAAHALPQSSDPSPGANLAVAPTAVTILFGEQPDPKLSRIGVLDTTGTSVTAGPTSAVPGDPKRLTVPLSPLKTGVYTVAWRTVSAVDGHLASGSFAFGVGATVSAGPGGQTPPTGSAITSQGPSPAAILARWLLFLGSIVLVGAAFFGWFVAVPGRAVTRILLPLAWLFAAVGTVAVLAVELSDAGIGLGDLVGTSLGSSAFTRVVPLLVAGIAVAVVYRSAAARPPALVVVGGGAAAALIADVLFSHAAAGVDAADDVIIQTVHVMAVALWLGGLAGLLLTIRGAPGSRTASAARGFSRVATGGIAAVAVTGLMRALAEVRTIDALVGTDFGRLVIAKTALLGGLAGLGAINHFRTVPAAGRSLRGLRRVGSVELLVGGTVLLLSATLVNLAPPAEVAASTGAAPSSNPGPVVASGADFGTSVRVRLEVSPGAAGFNTFSATVTDYDSGAPVAADGLTLRFVDPDRSDVGASRLDLAPVGAGSGVFRATGGNLSLDGTWRITVLVAQGTSSVEVPLQLATVGAVAAGSAPSPSPGPSIDVNAVPGLPTIYTVHLDLGRSIQVYLDPGSAGANEVHATFFDAEGTELPVETVTMTLVAKAEAGAASGSPGLPGPLTPRQLEPGHFVADTTLTAGTYTLSISGPAPDGTPLSTSLDLTVTN